MIACCSVCGAYAVRPDLITNNGRLLKYVENGGVVVVQYNTPEFDHNYGPYPYVMTSDPEEVTDENSVVRILNANNPCLPMAKRHHQQRTSTAGSKSAAQCSYPPGISTTSHCSKLTTPEQDPQEGGLMYARYGKGVYIYNALRFLPAASAGCPRSLSHLCQPAQPQEKPSTRRRQIAPATPHLRIQTRPTSHAHRDGSTDRTTRSAGWGMAGASVGQHPQHGRRGPVPHHPSRTRPPWVVRRPCSARIAGALLCLCDGLVWAELGSALPHSGGPYHYLLQAFGPRGWGRPMSFLFLWQSLLIGPISIASGAVGFGQYASFLAPSMGHWQLVFLAMALCLFKHLSALSQHPINQPGFNRHHPRRARYMRMDRHKRHPPLPCRARLQLSRTRLRSDTSPSGSASARPTLIATYDYGGYNNVCLLGDEIKSPRRTIPWAVIGSIVLVAILYLAMNLITSSAPCPGSRHKNQAPSSQITCKPFTATAAECWYRYSF